MEKTTHFTCIGQGHSAPVLPATREAWLTARRQRKLAQMCRLIEQGQTHLKHKLPIWTPSCAGFKNNHRSIADAQQPLPRLVMDIDEKGHTTDICAKALQLMKQGRWVVLLVEDSVRRGTHVIVEQPAGMSIEEAQQRFSHDIGYPVDASTKDVSRCLYLVPESYTAYVDERLFLPTSQPQHIVPAPPSELPFEAAPAAPAPLPATHPASYRGVPYATILQALIEELGGQPQEGDRNTKILRMASSLRHICDNNPDWLMEIIPTYGLPQEEWRKTIQNACKEGLKYSTTHVLNAALQRCNVEVKEVNEPRSMSHPPALPDKLPPMVELLTSKVPQETKAAVAHAIFPALGAHFCNVRFRYVNNVEFEPSFMCVLLAKQSSGKSAVNKPIEYILADIKERDELNRQREQEWKSTTNTKGSNKEKPKRPDDLSIQVLSTDMTNAALVQRLQDARGRFLYTQMDEIELLDQLKTSGKGNNVSQIIRLAFDCGLYGQERVSSQSVTARVKLRWNWNASSTIQKGKKYFRDSLSDGTLSRLNFCTIEPNRTGRIPLYGSYNDDYAEQLKPYIDRLNAACGLIECAEAEQLTNALIEENAETAALSDDEAYEMLSFRANVIAYSKAMTLYIAHGGWSEEIEAFVRWSEAYDLWCKMHFFGEQLNADIAKENIVVHRGPQNMLELLPERFTKEELIQLLNRLGKNSNPAALLSTWKYRGYITFRLGDTEYVKSSDDRKRR